MGSSEHSRDNPTPGYSGDMAYAHQTGNTDFARHAAPALIEQLRAAGIDGGLVVDLGCGSGVVARELVRAGYDVVGVDLSADMIRLAGETVPEATFVHGSFVDVELPACAAVTAVGQSLGYAFDTRNSPGELRKLFSRVQLALRPGGVFLFDLNAPHGQPEDDRHVPRWHCRDTPEWTLVAAAAVYDDTTLTRDFTLFRRVGDSYRRTDERHVVLLHDPDTVLADLESAGFAATRLDGYGDLCFPPDLVGYRAIRR